MPIPFILGATVVGGVLYLLTSNDGEDKDANSEEEQDNSPEEVVLSTQRIRELRSQLRKEEKRRKRFMQQVEARKFQEQGKTDFET